MSLAEAQPLSWLAEMTAAHVQSVQTDNPTRIRLLGMGIGKGTRIEVLRNRRGDIVLGTGNNRISLGRSISDKIMVHVQE
ncbi:FeoA family protein [Thiothrix nivea]|uniref:FeoA family protein n=1 Tax=Thiothrix nivea (strain ATCC 35100 / DSM 5205 / JP2) TaxID=870187 RepID=A0A656HK57_THINJ|nr:FeoA family protein [Thiothrix nivea]EIJ35700.1 FeoA family protein [Thiothrix nivea DSM 5205]